MNFIKQMFSKPKIECPRCLGKGIVDLDDIKRLKKEIMWIPGACAYCIGTGKVNSNMESKIPVDTTYLSTDLTSKERKMLVDNDPEALLRANIFETQTNSFILEVKFLHDECGIDLSKILEFFLLHRFAGSISEEERDELKDCIISIINHEENN